MNIVPFKREHLRAMTIQPNQRGLEALLTDRVYDELEGGMSYSAIDNDEVLACAGMIEITPGRAIAWSYISEDIGNRIISVTKAIKRAIEITGFRRIEMDVDCDFEQAHRWARMLGFSMECECRRSYTPDGRDCALYARVNHG